MDKCRIRYLLHFPHMNHIKWVIGYVACCNSSNTSMPGRKKTRTSLLRLVWFRMTQSGGRSASMRRLGAVGPPASLTWRIRLQMLSCRLCWSEQLPRTWTAAILKHASRGAIMTCLACSLPPMRFVFNRCISDFVVASIRKKTTTIMISNFRLNSSVP